MFTVLWYVLSAIVWFQVLYQVYKQQRDANRQTTEMNTTETGTGTIPTEEQPQRDPEDYEQQRQEKMERAQDFVQKCRHRLINDQTVMVGRRIETC
jgi:uncharacterized protein HemX